MEDQFQQSNNGQQIQQQDINLLGQVSSLADDRVFAELYRMAPFAGGVVSRAISHDSSVPLVQSFGGTGKVGVSAFRAFIGSRTTFAVSKLDNYRDIRTGIFAPTNTTSANPVTIAPNASGNTRWDLVYAIVTLGANTATVSRKVKDPTTKVITATNVVTRLVTSVTVDVIQGTPSATPAFPAILADAGSTYYIKLAYIRVPNGWTGTSTCPNANIYTVAPVLAMHEMTGATPLRPASGQNEQGGPNGISSATSWSTTSATRPAVYMPPSMMGGESIVVAINAVDVDSTLWTYAHGGVVDDSRDWRYRLFRWQVMTCAGGTARWPWNNLFDAPQTDFDVMPGAVNGPWATNVTSTSVHGANEATQRGLGQSCRGDVVIGDANTKGSVAWLKSGWNIPNTAMGAGFDNVIVTLYVDMTDGKLKFEQSGSTPFCSMFFWIDATAPYVNP